VISCDVSGVSYILNYTQGYFTFNVNSHLLMSKRLGAVYTLSPLLDYSRPVITAQKSNPYALQRSKQSEEAKN